MKVCSITKARPTKGSIIHRRGLAKKKGGIGQHVTKVVSRMFTPNLKTRRLWVTELNRFVTVKLTGVQFKPITTLLFATINMPDFRSSLTAEDSSGSQSN